MTYKKKYKMITVSYYSFFSLSKYIPQTVLSNMTTRTAYKNLKGNKPIFFKIVSFFFKDWLIMVVRFLSAAAASRCLRDAELNLPASSQQQQS